MVLVGTGRPVAAALADDESIAGPVAARIDLHRDAAGRGCGAAGDRDCDGQDLPRLQFPGVQDILLPFIVEHDRDVPGLEISDPLFPVGILQPAVLRLDEKQALRTGRQEIRPDFQPDAGIQLAAGQGDIHRRTGTDDGILVVAIQGHVESGFGEGAGTDGHPIGPGVDGKRIENNFLAHQVPISMAKPEEHLKILESWLRSYHPEELFDQNGRILPEIRALAPEGNRRIGANPHANGGLLLRDLRLPDFRDYAFDTQGHGERDGQDMIELGKFVRDIFTLNREAKNFRIFGPDETNSNRLNAVFEVENRDWNAGHLDTDDHLAPDGRVMDSMLSEHMCEGWLEGYLLTGRHGFFATYEAFARIIDSMAAQHAKWLKVCNQLPWREELASLNLIMASTVWQQDHNGFTHQDPGFMDHIANKKADVVRLYLPPDANCLLSTFDHCIRSRNYVNVIVASKHPRPQWLSMPEAVKHCTQGIGIWDWASNDQGQEPDIVFACAGETPTLEALAAVSILNSELPDVRIRFINVVDLFKLQPATEHPHGLTDAEYDILFTQDKPVIFAFHGYSSLVHELTYRRHNNRLMHVRGYKEEGTITTPFDVRVQNNVDRFHLVQEAIKYLPQLGNRGAYLYQRMSDKLVEHKQYIHQYGEDLPEVAGWKWTR